MPIPSRVRSRKRTTSRPLPSRLKPFRLALAGRDVVGIAQTGTGKTAAFALPILHRILEHRIKPQPKACRVLVLSPTRELSGTDSRKLQRLRPPYAPDFGAGDRRRADGTSGPLDHAGRRSHGGHARPPARSRAKQRLEARQCRVSRARRGRPHARHGLHQRHPEDRFQIAGQTPDAVLLGDDAEGYRRTRPTRCCAIRRGSR